MSIESGPSHENTAEQEAQRYDDQFRKTLEDFIVETSQSHPSDLRNAFREALRINQLREAVVMDTNDNMGLEGVSEIQKTLLPPILGLDPKKLSLIKLRELLLSADKK